MVRAVAANPADNVYCTILAHTCVHGAFAGLTNFMSGPINTRHAFVPLKTVAGRSNVVSVRDRMWSRLLFSTGQVCHRTSLDHRVLPFPSLDRDVEPRRAAHVDVKEKDSAVVNRPIDRTHTHTHTQRSSRR
jgi:hypothetical protein